MCSSDLVMQAGNGAMVECPIRPPSCPTARLAVARDRRLMLLAVAGQGLPGLRGVASAFRWLSENRGLLAMALPQFAIDAEQPPLLRLMVDCADLHADLLRPMLESPCVKVDTYRRVRWGQKMGLLLEAA